MYYTTVSTRPLKTMMTTHVRLGVLALDHTPEVALVALLVRHREQGVEKRVTAPCNPLLDPAERDVLELTDARDVVLDRLEYRGSVVVAHASRKNGNHRADSGIDIAHG